MNPKSGHELLCAASDGDETALDELVNRHLPGLEAFVRRNAGVVLTRKESCSDLVQSACREVLVDLEDHPYRDEDHFKNWLYLAAVRKIHQRGRYWGREKRDARQDALQESQFELPGRGLATPSQEVDALERLERVEEILETLPDSQRRVFFLSRVAGLGYDAIAEELEMTEEAVRKTYSRALARFMMAWNEA